jgi:hypothetical protein
MDKLKTTKTDQAADLSYEELPKIPERVDKDIQRFIADHMNGWGELQSEYENKQNNFGIDLSRKMVILCEELRRLVNPVMVTPEQQNTLGMMLSSLAGSERHEDLSDPGAAARLLLPIAIWLNSLNSQKR